MTDDQEAVRPPGAEPDPPPSQALSPRARLRMLGTGAILLALLSMVFAYGEWHVVTGARVYGSPAGDCAGNPCMEVLRDTWACRGSDHVGPAPLFLGGFVIAAQLLVLATRRRGLAIGLTIAQLPVLAAHASLPVLTSLSHLFDDSRLASTGSLFVFLNLLAGAIVVLQLILVVRKTAPAPPSGAPA